MNKWEEFKCAGCGKEWLTNEKIPANKKCKICRGEMDIYYRPKYKLPDVTYTKFIGSNFRRIRWAAEESINEAFTRIIKKITESGITELNEFRFETILNEVREESMGRSKGHEYLESLGFESFDIDFTSGVIDDDLGEYTEGTIYVNFERKTVVSWSPGYDPSAILGAGLKEEEMKKLEEIEDDKK